MARCVLTQLQRSMHFEIEFENCSAAAFNLTSKYRKEGCFELKIG
jgi:hypothetical protein